MDSYYYRCTTTTAVYREDATCIWISTNERNDDYRDTATAGTMLLRTRYDATEIPLLERFLLRKQMMTTEKLLLQG